MLLICGLHSRGICKVKILNKNLITVCVGTVVVSVICKIVSYWNLNSTIELFICIVLSGVSYLLCLLLLRNQYIVGAFDKVKCILH